MKNDLSNQMLNDSLIYVDYQMTIKADGRDWRSHLEQMHQHRDGIEESLQSTKTELDKLQVNCNTTN